MFGCVAVAILLVSCTGPGFDGEFGGMRGSVAARGPFHLPLIAVHYFPYSRSLIRKIASPIPDYHGWTDERMVKDLDRMGIAGISVVCVEVSSSAFSEPYRRERYAHFAALASRPGVNRPQVLFVLGAGFNAVPQLGQTFLGWFLSRRIGDFTGYYREDGRPVIGLGEGAEALTLYHPALRFRIFFGAQAEWKWEHVSVDDLRRMESGGGDPARVLSLCAGYTRGLRDRHGRLIWSIPRRRGRTLRNELRWVVRLRPRVVLLSSWNDFQSGDFIEPNSLDQSRAFEVLQRETLRWKRWAAREQQASR